MYFTTYVSTPSFHVDKAFPLRLTSGSASNTQFSFFLSEYFENLLIIFVHGLLRHLLNGNSDLRRHLHSFLQFSDAHLHLIAIIKVSQHAHGQVLDSNPSPSPFFPQFPVFCLQRGDSAFLEELEDIAATASCVLQEIPEGDLTSFALKNMICLSDAPCFGPRVEFFLMTKPGIEVKSQSAFWVVGGLRLYFKFTHNSN